MIRPRLAGFQLTGDNSVGNQRTKQTRTAGDYVDYTYDDIGQLKTAKGKESGGTERLQEKLGYAYDAAGNLQYRTNNALLHVFTVNSLNQLDDITRSGTYTVAGRVGQSVAPVSVTVSGTGLSSGAATLYGDFSWARAGATLADGNNTYTAEAEDGLGREDTHSVTAYLPATASYVYDDNGNLLSDGRRGFEYDDENQLTRVTLTNGWKSEFTYDGRMRRRVRKEYTWQSSAWVLTNEVRYVYDGNLVIQERDGNNVPSVTYTRGKDLSGGMEGAGGIGGLLALTRNSEPGTRNTVLYHADGNGNVTALASTNGLLLGAYYYDPYGNLLGLAGNAAEANLYRFSSKESHPNSGLVYYLYRYYEPNLQRWLNRDPIGELGFEHTRLKRRIQGPTSICSFTMTPLAESTAMACNLCLKLCLDWGFGGDSKWQGA